METNNSKWNVKIQRKLMLQETGHEKNCSKVNCQEFLINNNGEVKS